MCNQNSTNCTYCKHRQPAKALKAENLPNPPTSLSENGHSLHFEGSTP
jgi:hypothetical protein